VQSSFFLTPFWSVQATIGQNVSLFFTVARTAELLLPELGQN
jgi:hypothetical protein